MILFCKCNGSNIVPSSKVDAISTFLQKADLGFIEISNLCGAFERDQNCLQMLQKEDSLVVIACYPRTITGLLNISNIPTERATLFNLREDSVESIISDIQKLNLSKKSQINENIANDLEVGEGSCVGWFPIIDYQKCINCGQCMDFCLFGVYGRMDDKSIKVVKPENCKENCPACARVCPKIAIIFPKLSEKPINGSEIDESENKNLKLDIKDMFGDDVYTALAARKKRSKKKLLKSQSIIDAENERDKCIMQVLDLNGNKANSICSCNCSKKD